MWEDRLPPHDECLDDCQHNADCVGETTSSANSSSGNSMYTPMCCKCTKGPMVCMGQYACLTMSQAGCMTVP